MVTLIQIDRASIKRNPEAGSTMSRVYRGSERRRVRRWNDNGRGYSAESIGFRDKDGPQWSAERPIGSFGPWRSHELGETISERLLTEDIEHHPLPEWLYQYEPTRVTCAYCGATFLHSELTSDSFFDGEDDTLVEAICPRCEAGNCCEIQYEKIEDVVKAADFAIRV